MNFHKLNSFQLYSIIHSRHLDEEQKALAQEELNLRGLSDEELKIFSDKLDTTKKFLSPISQNILIIVIIFALFVLLLNWHTR